MKAKIRTVYLAERESSLKIAARTLMVVIATAAIYTLCLATFGYRNASVTCVSMLERATDNMDKLLKIMPGGE